MARSVKNVFIFSSTLLGGAEIAMSKIGQHFNDKVIFLVPSKMSLIYYHFSELEIQTNSYYEFFKSQYKVKAQYRLFSFGTKAFLLSTILKKINNNNIHVVNIRGADINRSNIKSRLYKTFGNSINYFLSNSSESIKYWEKRGEIKDKQVLVVRNLPPDNIRKNKNKNTKVHKIIAVVANLKRGKGYDHLQKLINNNTIKHDLTFKVYGKEIDFKFKDLKFTNPNINVKFMGFEKNQNLIYINIDLTLLLSDSEGVPNSFLEALVAGIPVISTNVGGTSELITNHSNGMLFDKGDIAKCADIINKFYSSKSLREKLRNPQILNEEYNKQKIIKHWSKLLEPNLILAKPQQP